MKRNKGHIAIFIPSFLGGGAERMMVYLANSFKSKGYHVDFIVIKNNGPYKSLISEDVNIIDLNKKRVLFSILSLAKYLRKHRPYVLLSAMNYVNIASCFALKVSFTKTKLVVSERTIPSLRMLNNSKGFLFKFLLKWVYSHVDKIIAISNSVKEDLIRNFNIKDNQIEVIYNMVDISNIKQIAYEEKDKLYRSCFGDNDYSTVQIIIGIGRLEEYKNFSYLIDAFYNVSLENDHVKLIILGDGPEKESLIKQIKKFKLENKVKLLGFVNNPNDYLQISSLFVSTSKFEGFGNVIIEAMSVGLPVIVTDCIGGPKEIVDFGKYGDIVPLNNVGFLSKTISKTLAQNKHPDVIKRASSFSVDIISEKYLQILFE